MNRTAVGVSSSSVSSGGSRRIRVVHRRRRFMGGLPLEMLLLLLLLLPFLNSNDNHMMVVDAQTDNATAPTECLTALFNADLDGDNRLNKAEYFNAMMSLSNDDDSTTCPDLNDLTELLAAPDSSAFTNNFNNLKCACFDYRYDDPLCCQVFNFAIRLPDETYPVDYANRICNGIAQALWNECGIQAPWLIASETTTTPTATPTTTLRPTTAAPTTIPPTSAPTVGTVEETTAVPMPSVSPVVVVSTGPTADPTIAPSSVPPFIIIVGEEEEEDDDNNDDASTTSTPIGVAEANKNKETQSMAEDNDDNSKKTRTLAALLSVFGILVCAAVALFVQRYRQEQEFPLKGAVAADNDDIISAADQHSIQAVAVKGAINPFGLDSTEEEISEVTLEDADLESARAILAGEGPPITTATSYAQLQFTTTNNGGGGSVKSTEVDDGDDDNEDPTGPTAVLPFRHLEKDSSSSSNDKKDKSKNTPRVRMWRLLNALTAEASSPSPQPQPQQQQQQQESSIHDHITPLKSNTTLSRQGSPVNIFDSQDEDDFEDEPSAAELLRSDSADSWGAALRQALGLGDDADGPSEEQEQKHQQKQQHEVEQHRQEQRDNERDAVQANTTDDDHEQTQLQQHYRLMHHYHHRHDLRPRTLDFDGDSSAPDSSAGGSGWSDGSSTTTFESQEEDETAPSATAASGSSSSSRSNNDEKQWEWVRSFGGQFQF